MNIVCTSRWSTLVSAFYIANYNRLLLTNNNPTFTIATKFKFSPLYGQKGIKIEREERLTAIYCHFRLCCVWVRALPQAPGRPQHSTAALKETRRCCHHGRVAHKVFTYGHSYLEWLVRRTEAGRWPCWFLGCFWKFQAVFEKKERKKEKRKKPRGWFRFGSCRDGQKHLTKIFSIRLWSGDCAQASELRC